MVYEGLTAINLDPVNHKDWIESGQCLLKKTYTITNISGGTLENVKFYQLMHAHPGDRYDGAVTGVYDPAFHNGALNYPDYRYDISFWADNEANQTTQYIGFSSAVEPDNYDIDTFYAGSPPEVGCSGGKPTSGLVPDVEAGTLSGNDDLGPNQTAGAMEWDLGYMANGEQRQIDIIVAVAPQTYEGRDSDGDGIADDIDTEPTTACDTICEFTDEHTSPPLGSKPITHGYILYWDSTSPQVNVVDSSNDNAVQHGVYAQASGTGVGSTSLYGCDGIDATVKLTGDDKAWFTCTDSFNLKVDLGPIEVIFGSGEDNFALVSTAGEADISKLTEAE